MHQRVTTDPVRILQMYQEGLLDEVAAANDLIETTTALPTAELVALCPTDVIERIEFLAKTLPFVEVLHVFRSFPSDTDPKSGSEVITAAEQEARERWDTGLAIWKTYFGISM